MTGLETFHIYPINWKCFQISATHFELLSEEFLAVKRTDVTGTPCIIMCCERVSHGQHPPTIGLVETLLCPCSMK